MAQRARQADGQAGRAPRAPARAHLDEHVKAAAAAKAVEQVREPGVPLLANSLDVRARAPRRGAAVRRAARAERAREAVGHLAARRRARVAAATAGGRQRHLQIA